MEDAGSTLYGMVMLNALICVVFIITSLCGEHRRAGEINRKMEDIGKQLSGSSPNDAQQ